MFARRWDDLADRPPRTTGTKMKAGLTTAGCVAGLLYGGFAIAFLYSDAPLDLQVFLVSGVAAVGASAGWFAGLLLGVFRCEGKP